jgi:hypothetical protein
VRLSYAGKELPPSLDASLLQLKPGIDVVAALPRFQGGGVENSSSSTTSDGMAATGSTVASAEQSSSISRRRPSSVLKRPPVQRISKLEWAATSDDVYPERRRQSAKTVPGGRQGCSAELQLARQFRDLMRNPIPGVNAAPSDDSLFIWNVQVRRILTFTSRHAKDHNNAA